MAQLGNWFSRVFSADGTRGLSGDASFIAGEHGRGGFFASRLRLHQAGGDLVEQPELLWDLGQPGRRRGGLVKHVANEQGDGVAGFSDVLVVINRADWMRAVEETGEYWQQEAAEVLHEQLAAWCKQYQFNAVFPERGFQVALVCDGGEALRGHAIGLEPGQFVTALLPNRYGAPLPNSSPVLVVHLNIPGAWEGYRKVGTVYSDQLCFTLGSHWLDNFCHEALEVPALYQLQQYPDGSLVHVINPEHQQRFEVGSVQSAEGPSVLAITERGGAPLAFLVLGVVDTFMREGAEEPGAPPPSGPPAVLAPEPAAPAAAPEPSPAPAVEGAAAISPAAEAGAPSGRAAVQLAGESRSPLGSEPAIKARGSGGPWHHTIVPDAVEERICTLKERGALLQRVHFSAFMLGYDVYVSRSGQLGTALVEREAVFQIREDRVFLVPLSAQVLIAGRPAQPDKPLRLRGDLEVRIGNQLLEYRDLSAVAAEGWPYLGEIRRTAGSTYLVFGTVYRIGRDRRCKVRLPDEPHNENIVWRQEMGGGEFIRSRTGDIPKSRFYNDSIMVASLHAEIDLEGEPILRNLARHCFSYVRRGADLLALHPGRDEKGLKHVDLLPGDELLVGNNLFEVSYPPPRTPEVEKLTAEALARAAQSLPDESFVEDPCAARVDLRLVPPSQPGPLRALVEPDRTEDAPLSPPDAPALRLAPEARRPSVSRPEPTTPPEFSPAPAPVLEPPPAPAPPAPALECPAPQPLQAAPAPERTRNPVEVLGLLPDPGTSTLAQRHEELPPPPVPPPAPARLVETAAPAIDPSQLAAAEDAPVAGGLGENGPAPDRIPLGGPALDSLLGIEPPLPAHLDDSARVAASPVAEPAPPPPAPVRIAAARPRQDEVVVVDESGWQLALSRPARLQQVGWTVSGSALLGNHRGAQLVVPESRCGPHQGFQAQDYVRLSVRGKRGLIERVGGADLRLLVDGRPVASTENLWAAIVEVPRRDETGEEDFTVGLRLRAEPWLPDPRAALLAIDLQERSVAALFSIGFPLRAAVPLRLGPVDCVGHYDGQRLRISDYLDSYAFPEGRYQPFFWRCGDARFRTAPEDGASFELRDGDMIIAGSAVYRFSEG